MIITSLLLCVLIYAQSGWIGEHLSPVLGGIMGWIKYIIPIGTLAMAIKIAAYGTVTHLQFMVPYASECGYFVFRIVQQPEKPHPFPTPE